MATQTPRKDNTHGGPDVDLDPRITGENNSRLYDDAQPYSNQTSSPGSDALPGNSTQGGSSSYSSGGRRSNPWSGGSSTSGDSTGGQSSSSGAVNRNDLGAQESSGSGGSSGAIDSKEQSLMGSGGGRGLYRNEAPSRFSKAKGKLTKFTRKRIATVAITGLVGGGGIFGASYLQGPFQLVHFSQKLQGIFSQRQDEDNSRMGKIARYIYHTKRGDGAKGVRLGRLGNTYANKIEAKLNRSGIETTYTEKLQYRSGYRIDPENVQGTDLDKYQKFDSKGDIDRGATNKAIKAGLEQEFGVEVDAKGNGTLEIDTKKMDGNFRMAKSFDKFMLRTAGFSGKTTAVIARIMGKRAGITWHPVKKADRKINMAAEAKYKDWRDKRKEKIKGGEGTKASVKSGESNDPNDTPEQKEAKKQGVDKETAAGNAVSEEGGKASGGDSSSIDKFQQSTRSKLLSRGAGVIGTACVFKALDEGADGIKEKEVIAPAMRIAGDFVSVGSQVQAGDDIDMQQAGYFAKQLYGKDSSGNKSSWNQSQSQKATNNKEGGVAPLATLTTIAEGSPFGFIKQPPLDTLLGPACSTGGMIATIAVGVATGGALYTIGSTVVAALVLPSAMSQVADWLAGNALNPLPVGADMGNTASFGAKLMGRYQGASGGGRELSNTETAQYEQLKGEESKNELASKSLAYRLFNPSSSRTLTASVIDSNALSSDGVASFVSNPFKTFGSLFSQTGNLFTPKAFAAVEKPTDKVKDVGFSVDELQDSSVNNPFQNAEDVTQKKFLQDHPDYPDRAKKCFGVTVDPSSGDVTSLNDGNPTFKDMQSGECTDKSKPYMQFRMYIKDTQVMTSVACQEDDEESCADIGASSTGSGSGANSSGDNQADGDAQKPCDEENLDDNSPDYCKPKVPCTKDHIYKPGRLQYKGCRVVTGKIVWEELNTDGDYHAFMKVDPPYEGLMNDRQEDIKKSFRKLFKSAPTGKYLMIEDICIKPPTGNSEFEDSVPDACGKYRSPFPIVEPGKRYRITGNWVTDNDQKRHTGWAEIHGLSEVKGIK